jgi:D-glycero-D-manno-heptose 1,7-bisphosphate phosphatase
VQKRPVVFLDRDGTLNEEVGYIHELEKLVLIKGAAAAIKKLNRAGIAAILVTNQSGAARGYYAESHIKDLNARLVRLLEESGARMDAVYYCPHIPEPEGTVAPYATECECRKPAPGLIQQAYAEHPDLDPSRAYVVGDKATDVELAQNSRAKGVLVVTGYGQRVLNGEYQWKVQPDHIADDIVHAIDWILEDLKSR